MTQPNEPAEGASDDQPSATPQWPSAGAQDSSVPPPPPAPPYQPMPQTSNSAIVALVLSIVSWVVCPVIPAIVALVFASKADREIAVSNGWVTGGGLVTASKIVAWINIGLYAGLIAIGLIIVILAAVGGAFA
ncbi:MAG TPA: DUF4190 domain-containing protein [Candidatus Nanopelagicales bacterium]|nr:DUF4190 domain-containing protein [Candidatus Nanopelagicales bacterium]